MRNKIMNECSKLGHQLLEDGYIRNRMRRSRDDKCVVARLETFSSCPS